MQIDAELALVGKQLICWVSSQGCWFFIGSLLQHPEIKWIHMLSRENPPYSPLHLVNDLFCFISGLFSPSSTH